MVEMHDDQLGAAAAEAAARAFGSGWRHSSTLQYPRDIQLLAGEEAVKTSGGGLGIRQ